MAIGFPAYYKDRKKLKFSKEKTKEISTSVLIKMNCNELGFHPFDLDFITQGSGMLDSGERIYVNITATEIIIRSECVLVSRIFDFGKNKANIQQFWYLYYKEN